MAQLDLKSPAVQKGLLYVLAGGSLLGLFFLTSFIPFGYKNQHAKIVALKSEYDKKATDLSRARATVADLPRFEAEYASLHERWAQVAEQLPTDRQLPALMRKITLAAQQNGVNFLTFRPSGPKQDQHFTETPIQLAVYGNYHELGSFLADLANMRRIITVSGVTVKTNTRAHPATATATADFTASAYHLNTTSTAPPAPPEAQQAKKEESHGKES